MGLENASSDATEALTVVSRALCRISVAEAHLVSRHLLSDEHELDTELTIAVPAPRANNLTSNLVLVHSDLMVCVVVDHVPIVTE
jgi:hypothetical protein